MFKFYYWLRDAFSKPGERGEASAGYWQDKVRRRALEFYSNKTGRLLEVGCGEGLFLRKLMPIGNNKRGLFGLDISYSQLKKAHQRCNSFANVIQADISAIPFSDNSFDTIVCINVFMNIEDGRVVDKAISELSRVGRSGCAVIFDIRNKLSPIIRLKYKLAKYYDATIDSSRLRLYDPDIFEQKLSKAGFRIAHKATIGFPAGKFAPIVVMQAINQKK